MTYTSVAALKAELGISAPKDDAILLAKIQAAQAEIERYTGKTFEAATATRSYNEFYRGWDLEQGVLLLDKELLSVTTLTNGDGTVIASSGYWLEPQNQGYYTAIRLKSAYAWAFDDDASVTILGSWGYSSTAPADIAEACRELAIYLYRLKDVSNLSYHTAVPDMGDVPVPIDLPKHVKAMLNSYRSLI